jgi:hypothetical protein
MKSRFTLATLVVAALALAAVFGMHAFAGGGKSELKADTLIGYQESTPAAVSSPATGTFELSIDDASQTISYTLTYSGLAAPATQAHIHLGNRAQNGAVVAFLCGGAPPVSNKPACPAGTTTQAVVTGTITPADVSALAAGQGIAAGEWNELVDALRAGAAYANVHDGTFPAGEIRGQINDDNQRQPE